jgi:hypothetical protein
MTKKELAVLLGVSASMVTKHSKQGMPTDSLERAQRWRKRHLEPGRVKGNRFDPNSDKSPPAAHTASLTAVKPRVSLKVLEVSAVALNAALASGDQDTSAKHLTHLRSRLRELPDEAQPCMSLRVWLALVDYVLSEAAPVRNATNMDEAMTLTDFGMLAFPVLLSPLFCLDHARDWSGFSISGFPACSDIE